MATTARDADTTRDRRDAGPMADRAGDPFPTAAARAALMAMYDAKLARWPVPYVEMDLPTTWGTAHVVAAGAPSAPPLLMLHMTGAPAFAWTPIIGPLAGRYRTYAVDIIGDMTKSVLSDPRRHPKNGEELAAWVAEVADGLGVASSDVLGGSFGGWLAAHYAARSPERVRRLVLLVPMGLPSWTQTVRVLARLMSLLVGQSPARIEQALSWMMGDNPAVRALIGDWMKEVIRQHCRARVPNPLPLAAALLARVHAPTLLILGGRDRLIGDAGRAAARATRRLRDVTVSIVPNGTHAVHGEEPDRIAAEVLTFLGASAAHASLN